MHGLCSVVALILVVLISVQLVGSFRFGVRIESAQPFASSQRVRRSSLSTATDSVWAVEFDDGEELESFQRITRNYLTNKFQACVGEDCQIIRSKDAAKELLAEVLPPVTPQELEDEVKNIFASLEGDNIGVTEFVNAVADNSYWRAAGTNLFAFLALLCTFSPNFDAFFYRTDGSARSCLPRLCVFHILSQGSGFCFEPSDT